MERITATTYEVTGPSRYVMPVVIVGQLVVLLVLFTLAPVVAAFGLVGVAFMVRRSRRTVRRVEADDRGLRLVAPARTIEITWPDLVSIRYEPRTSRSLISWRWEGGSAEVPADLVGLDHLVAQVRARCPAATVDPRLPGAQGPTRSAGGGRLVGHRPDHTPVVDVHRVDASWTHGMPVICGAFLVIGLALEVVAIVAMDPVRIVVIAAWTAGVCLMIWATLRVPTSIEVGLSGLRFVARLRTTEVDWADLRSVRSGRRSAGASEIVWRSANGRVRTAARIDDLGGLLDEVEARSRADVQVQHPGRHSQPDPW